MAKRYTDEFRRDAVNITDLRHLRLNYMTIAQIDCDAARRNAHRQ